MPHFPAGAGIHGNQRIRIEIVAGPRHAVIVARRRAERQIDEAEFFIGAEGRPDLGLAAHPPGVIFPRFHPRFAFARHGVEGPQQLAGAHIEAAHIAGERGLVDVGNAGGDRLAANDDHIPHHNRRRCRPRKYRLGRFAQIDPALIAEIRDRLAGAGIEHIEIGAAHGDNAGCRTLAPQRQRPAGRCRGEPCITGKGRLTPDDPAACRITRLHQADLVADVHHPAHHQRRVAEIV